jgi:acetyl-CoA C-acetyltransferase/acetyl-CoA acyltransferase
VSPVTDGATSVWVATKAGLARLPDNTQFARLEDFDIHEAFAAQVLANVAALEDKHWIKGKTGIRGDSGAFPWDRVNPNGSSIAIGHPFAATGARDLSQCVKELFAMPAVSRAVVSVCADGGQGVVALLERP